METVAIWVVDQNYKPVKPAVVIVENEKKEDSNAE